MSKLESNIKFRDWSKGKEQTKWNDRWPDSSHYEHEQKQWFWPLIALIIEKQWGTDEQLFLRWT